METPAALTIDACDPVAWRFLADDLLNQEKKEEAWTASLHAVDCDPTYAPGWATILRIGALTGRRLDRPPVDRDNVATVGPSEDPHAATRATLEPVLWLTHDGAASAATGTPLERRRAGVTAALVLYDKRTPEFGDVAVWSTLSAANAQGRLDAAIFVLLLDAELANEFLAWRGAHVEEAVAFIDQQLVER
jgi:hypothetical protein